MQVGSLSDQKEVFKQVLVTYPVQYCNDWPLICYIKKRYLLQKIDNNDTSTML